MDRLDGMTVSILVDDSFARARRQEQHTA